jgi:hypothetical protein
MTVRRNRAATAFCCLVFAAALSSPSLAQEAEPVAEAPQAQPQTYRAYREELIAQGWKPDVKYGLKTADGKALYRFPEVVCGPQRCSGKWRDKQGAEKLIPILRGDGKEEYRLAP